MLKSTSGMCSRVGELRVSHKHKESTIRSGRRYNHDNYSNLYERIFELLSNREFESLLNEVYGYNFSESVRKSTIILGAHPVDYHILVTLLWCANQKYKELFYLKSNINYTEIRDVINKTRHVSRNVDYFLVVHKYDSSLLDLFDFDHVSVYDVQRDYVYDIMQNPGLIYFEHTSCAFNCLLYILSRRYASSSSKKTASMQHKRMRKITFVIYILFKLLQQMPSTITKFHENYIN